MTILALQIVLPAFLLAWQAHGRDTNIVSWTLKHAAAWSYIYATTVAGLWLPAAWRRWCGAAGTHAADRECGRH